MASDINFVEFIVDQMGSAGNISQKKMFGEHDVHCDGKVEALISEDVAKAYGKAVSVGAISLNPPSQKPF